jgi:hypothetical protein
MLQSPDFVPCGARQARSGQRCHSWEHFEFAQEAPPVHRGDWPIHNRHKYQPNQDELKELDLQNVTRRDAKEVDRLYNQLESTGGEPQSGDELDEGGFDREIQEENRRLDRIRGAEGAPRRNG